MTASILFQRSVGTDLAYRILSRSSPRIDISRPSPDNAGDGLSTFVLPDPQPDILRPASTPVSKSPALSTSALSGLNRTIVSRIRRYDSHIDRYTRSNGIDANLVRALIYVESSGDPSAVSPKGALGLMQLMPGTASDMGVSNPMDPAQNIFGGTKYIGNLLTRFDRLDLALWAYNAGPESVIRRRLPRETKRFIPEVLRVKSILEQAGS